jgi:hypothetical protein
MTEEELTQQRLEALKQDAKKARGKNLLATVEGSRFLYEFRPALCERLVELALEGLRRGSKSYKGDETMNHHCCFIPDREQEAATKGEAVKGCPNKPEWQIWHGETSDDNTVACTEHVGQLLTDALEHRIYRLED